MTDFYKAVAAFAGMIVALIALAAALGWPPGPDPTPTPPPTPVPTSTPQVTPTPPTFPGPSVIDDTTRAVPDVTGLQGQEAINKLSDDGFQPRPGGFESSALVPFGAVTRTDPPAGTQATKGAPVTFFISKGQ